MLLTCIPAAVLLFLFLRNLPGKGSKKLRLVRFLRLMTLLLLILLMFRPSFVRTTVRPLPATIFCLLDLSESMSIADEKDGLTRFDFMKKILAQNNDRFRQLAEKYDLRFLTFDRDLAPLTPQNGQLQIPYPNGKETALGRALSNAFQQTVGKRVPGVLLFSDGTEQTSEPENTLPQTAAFRFRDAGIPLYALGLGSTDSNRTVLDYSVRELNSNDRVYKGNELQITGRIRVTGAKNRDIPLEFYFENSKGQMEKIDQKIFRPNTDGEEIFSWRFVYVPREVGERKLSVSIPPDTKELSRDNNKLESFVKVEDGELRVLYLEGTRRFEQKYLRLSLAASSEIKIDYRRPVPHLMLNKKGATEAERNAQATLQRQSLAKEFFQQGKYNVYLLGDLDASAFKKDELEALTARISEGAGLIVLAGERSLSAGGYADTPLKALLPVELNAADRIPLNLGIDTYDQTLPEQQQIRQRGLFEFIPTKIGSVNYILRLDRDAQKNIKIWQMLPPLENAWRTGLPKPGAIVLANALPINNNSATGALPLLITHNYGLGRVTVFAADSTWKWRLGGMENIHRKFWRQLILWSANLDEPPRGILTVELDKSRYLCGQSAPFRLVYLAKEDEKSDDLERIVSVTDPKGSVTTPPLTDEDGSFTGIVQNTDLPGDYKITAAIRSKRTGKEIQSAQARLLVYQANPELDNSTPSPAVLENITSLTGGKTIKAEELPSLIDKLNQSRETLNEVRKEKIALYDSWPIFGLFVFLLSAEWFLRKKNGMI